MDANQIVTLPDGGVAYSAEKAATPIDDLIDALEDAKAEGATHVVALSGNYRGPRYARVGTEWEWVV